MRGSHHSHREEFLPKYSLRSSHAELEGSHKDPTPGPAHTAERILSFLLFPSHIVIGLYGRDSKPKHKLLIYGRIKIAPIAARGSGSAQPRCCRGQAALTARIAAGQLAAPIPPCLAAPGHSSKPRGRGRDGARAARPPALRRGRPSRIPRNAAGLRALRRRGSPRDAGHGGTAERRCPAGTCEPRWLFHCFSWLAASSRPSAILRSPATPEAGRAARSGGAVFAPGEEAAAAGGQAAARSRCHPAGTLRRRRVPPAAAAGSGKQRH